MRNAHLLLLGMHTNAASLEIWMQNTQKHKSESTIKTRYVIPWPKSKELHILLHRWAMFIGALVILAKEWKQPKCPSVDEWIVIYIHHGILISYNKMESWNLQVASLTRKY